MLILTFLFSITIFLCLQPLVHANADEDGDEDTEQHIELEIPALGRHVLLGTLYDHKTGVFIGGGSMRPWRMDTLEQHTKERLRPHETSDAIACEDMESKLGAFFVGASIKADLLSGLLKVEGSAEFVKQETGSNYEVTVGFKYEKLTHSKTLSQDIITNPDDMDMIYKQPKATHVVNSITFGASVVFTFTKTIDNKFDKQKIAGALQAKLAISFAAVEGAVSLNFTDEEKKELTKMRTNFVGDVNLPSMPQTFIDALKTFESVPSLINKSTAKPMRIHLLPIKLLHTEESRLARSISQDVDKQFTARMMEYEDLLRHHNFIS